MTIASLSVALIGVVVTAVADDAQPDPEPPVVDPGPVGGPPADAFVLFDGKDLAKWRGERGPEPKWKLESGYMETAPEGGIFSKEEFTDCQLHEEWVDACRKPGEWQTYDIIFHAPRKQAEAKMQPGSFTVLHNGVLIQDHIPVGPEPTTAAPLQGLVEKAPLYLQDHGNPVR